MRERPVAYKTQKFFFRYCLAFYRKFADSSSRLTLTKRIFMKLNSLSEQRPTLLKVRQQNSVTNNLKLQCHSIKYIFRFQPRWQHNKLLNFHLHGHTGEWEKNTSKQVGKTKGQFCYDPHPHPLHGTIQLGRNSASLRLVSLRPTRL